MKDLSKFLSTTAKKYLNENVNNYIKLTDLAKQYDYDILYRGMYDTELTDKSFFTDYIGHATEQERTNIY